MISIQLKNFQAHKDSTFEFCRGVNVIIGTSFHGKTTLLRAVRWVKDNRPITTGIIRRAAGSISKKGVKKIGTAEVIMVMQSETDPEKADVVTKIRGPEVNEYKVNDSSFKVVGRAVPEDVTQALNLDEINIQDQLELPYLLLDTPGVVAATFNKFTNLDKVGATVDFLSSDLRARRSEKLEAENLSKKLSQQIEGYSYLTELKELVTILNEIADELEIATERETILTEIIRRMQENEEKVKQTVERIKTLKPVVEEANRLLPKIQNLDVEQEKSFALVEHLSHNIRDIGDAQERLREITVALPVRRKELGIRKKQILTAKQVEDLESTEEAEQGLIDKIKDTEFQIIGRKNNLEQFHIEMKAVKSELGKIDVCVTCGSKLTDKTRKTMLQNLEEL